MPNIDDPNGPWIPVLSGALGGILGVIGTVMTALIHNQNSTQSFVDARMRLLIESYENRIADLERQVKQLEAEIGSNRNVSSGNS